MFVSLTSMGHSVPVMKIQSQIYRFNLAYVLTVVPSTSILGFLSVFYTALYRGWDMNLSLFHMCFSSLLAE